MKKIFLFIAITISIVSEAQVSTVSLQASGLTCSMCSNSISKALKTLDFVQDVNADFKTYTFEISFKPNSVIDFDMLRKKVEGAGFFVCAFIATIHFDNIEVKNNQSIKVESKTFLFLNNKDLVLNGDKKVKILNKGFVSSKEYKKNNFLASAAQTYYVVL